MEDRSRNKDRDLFHPRSVKYGGRKGRGKFGIETMTPKAKLRDEKGVEPPKIKTANDVHRNRRPEGLIDNIEAVCG